MLTKNQKLLNPSNMRELIYFAFMKCRVIYIASAETSLTAALTTCLKAFPNLSVVSLPRGSHVKGIRAGVSVLLE